MSFVDRIFDNIGLANQHASQGRKAVEELIQFLKLLISAEENYAKSLDSIYNFQFLLLKGSLYEAGEVLKSDISNKAAQARTFIENLTQDILKPLQSISSYPIDQAKILSGEFSKVVKLRDTYNEKLAKHKEKFWKSCSECERITQSLEQPQIQNTREQLLQKLIKHKALLETNLQAYQNHIDSWDEFMGGYKVLVVPIIEGYEKNEIFRLRGVKDQLRKFVVYQASYIRNLQYEIDTLAKAMEDLEVDNDLKAFCPISTKPTKPEFEAYHGTHPSYKNINSSGLSIPIPLPIQEAKWSEIVFQGSLEEMYKTEIDIISLKACQGYELSSEDFAQFNSLIKDSFGRKAWVWSMNQKKSEPQLSDKGYLQLGELMLSVLNECERAFDISTVKMLIQFASVFYKQSAEIKHNFVKLISSHSILTKGEVWDKLIEISILDEINSHQVVGVNHKEEERKKLIGNIAFCQLAAMADVMSQFQVSPEVSIEVLNKHGLRYELTPEDLDVFISAIRGKREKETNRVLTVQRGIPAWLQGLETSAGASIKRTPKTLSGLLTSDKNPE